MPPGTFHKPLSVPHFTASRLCKPFAIFYHQLSLLKIITHRIRSPDNVLNRIQADTAELHGPAPSGGEAQLVRRQLDLDPGAAVLVDELDQVRVGGVEDMDDGADLAGLEVPVRQIGAELDAVQVAVAARRLPAPSSGQMRL